MTYLCQLSELRHDSAIGLDPWCDGRDTLIALRYGDGVRVFRNNCPHYDVPMHYRKNGFMTADGQHLVCFAHGALFRPDSGECVLGPCLGQSLKALEVSIDDKGSVWLVG
ncbi:(2Fe-2S)-binding protein [Marinobacterium nitratireducens]|uniref:(2Fe-2S)-binding protein n=1 Tax=Marinobacterium nitratireducens TaxID=518897 RepID=A0A918DPJ3_9GAMM|nr:Rieske (2Fe-2S) protein [Marinobacterium nitratireducens]GGO76495.1 (2Fe-2S)-binding protein [Marinobacterium nitratireducens]